MVRVGGLLCVAGIGLLLNACGSDSKTSAVATSTARGTLIQTPPPRLASLNASALTAELNASATGQQLLELAGTPACGVDFYYIQYYTIGGRGETATASGALMVPTGSSAQCSGARPVVLYAHGTSTDKTMNLANPADPSNTEGVEIATVYAAQGYIVVAPNYVGYDTSSLNYHPYVNAAQNAADMMDALTAATTALPTTFTPATTGNGQLFITGYSEGGYVAMATHRAMQSANISVTAESPGSGPFALAAFGDAVFYGNVNLGSTVFSPLITTSYQTAYGNVYQSTSDFYEPQFATGIATLLPSAVPLTTLFQNGELPQTELFSSTPPVTPNAQLNALFVEITPPQPPLVTPAQAELFALGFGTDNLITNDYRVAYMSDALANPDGLVPTQTTGLPATAPALGLRQDFKLNDLRGWVPHAPILMCGGDQDPTVFFNINTLAMQALWAGLPAGLISVVDLNATPGANDPFAPLQLGFQETIAEIAATEGQTAAVEAYHTTEAPFCAVAARAFFSQL